MAILERSKRMHSYNIDLMKGIILNKFAKQIEKIGGTDNGVDLTKNKDISKMRFNGDAQDPRETFQETARTTLGDIYSLKFQKSIKGENGFLSEISHQKDVRDKIEAEVSEIQLLNFASNCVVGFETLKNSMGSYDKLFMKELKKYVTDNLSSQAADVDLNSIKSKKSFLRELKTQTSKHERLLKDYNSIKESIAAIKVKLREKMIQKVELNKKVGQLQRDFEVLKEKAKKKKNDKRMSEAQRLLLNQITGDKTDHSKEPPGSQVGLVGIQNAGISLKRSESTNKTEGRLGAKFRSVKLDEVREGDQEEEASHNAQQGTSNRTGNFSSMVNSSSTRRAPGANRESAQTPRKFIQTTDINNKPVKKSNTLSVSKPDRSAFRRRSQRRLRRRSGIMNPKAIIAAHLHRNQHLLKFVKADLDAKKLALKDLKHKRKQCKSVLVNNTKMLLKWPKNLHDLGLNFLTYLEHKLEIDGVLNPDMLGGEFLGPEKAYLIDYCKLKMLWKKWEEGKQERLMKEVDGDLGMIFKGMRKSITLGGVSPRAGISEFQKMSPPERVKSRFSVKKKCFIDFLSLLEFSR